MKKYENLEAEELIKEATKLMNQPNRTSFHKDKADKLMELAQLKAMERAFESAPSTGYNSERRFYHRDSPEFFTIKAKVGSNYYEMDLKTQDDIEVANHLMNIYLSKLVPKEEPEDIQ